MSEQNIPIKKEFRSYFADSGELKNRENNFTPLLIGNPRQFILQQGSYYCVRDGCQGCPYENRGCEFQETKIPNLVVPSARRGVGFENKSFLVLTLKPGFEFRKPASQDEIDSPALVPLHLWNTEDDDKSLDPRNLHFVLSKLDKPFHVMKGQFRFYGTHEEFSASEYSKYFDLFDSYKLKNRIFAFDFSAIEPRFSAIALCNPASSWVKLFEGTPKAIVREVDIGEFDQNKLKSIYIHEKVKYCLLLGELDKGDFETQCSKCDLKCSTLKEHFKNIPGDFHAINTKAFMPLEFEACFELVEVFPRTIKKVSSPISGEGIIQIGDSSFCFTSICDSKCSSFGKCETLEELTFKESSSDFVLYVSASGGEYSLPKKDIPKTTKRVIKDKSVYSHLRGIGKQNGLAIVYGLSAYNMAKNLGISQEEANKIMDNFFKALPEVKNYMLHSDMRVIKTGKIHNMFGRSWNVKRWSHFKGDLKETMSAQGYAKRQGYNFPIQSTSAEALKIAMIRADELIMKNFWNPLYGSTPRRILTPADRDSFICAMAMSIHDELDFLMDYQKIDMMIPTLYTTLQIKDVVKSLGVDFDLEQDVEFDEWGAFTATSRYHNSRIFLLNLLKAQEGQPPRSLSVDILAIFEEKNISQDFIYLLNKVKGISDISSSMVKVAIDGPGGFLVFPEKIDRKYLSDFRALAGDYRLFSIQT